MVKIYQEMIQIGLRPVLTHAVKAVSARRCLRSMKVWKGVVRTII